MNILVIGNGFDIAHNLHTKYEHFLTYAAICRDNYEVFSNKEPIQGIYDMEADEFRKSCIMSLGCIFDGTDRSKGQEFYELIADNRWISYFEPIYEDRSKGGNDGWIDFEKEIFSVIDTLDNFRKRASHLWSVNGPGYVDLTSAEKVMLKPLLSDETGEYVTSIDDFDNIKKILLTDLNRLTRALEIYLLLYSCKEKVNDSEIANTISFFNKLPVDRVLSFNYTDTYRRRYGKAETTYDYIHGYANIESSVDTCNMVIGIHEYLNGDEKNHDNYFIEFKKFFQCIYKKTGSKYSEWLKKYTETRRALAKSANKPELNIYFYGHSLDVTDKDIIYRLIMAEGAKTTIYYHSQKALNEQIAHLVDIIGEETLIQKTDSANEEILFQPI